MDLTEVIPELSEKMFLRARAAPLSASKSCREKSQSGVNRAISFRFKRREGAAGDRKRKNTKTPIEFEKPVAYRWYIGIILWMSRNGTNQPSVLRASQDSLLMSSFLYISSDPT